MLPIRVSYFALFRELAKCDSEDILTSSITYKDLYLELSQKYRLNLPADMVQVAVNDEFASMNDTLSHSAKVVFIPPVAGG
jgi:molybdopterin synthase sulfur carrier subunit